MHVLVTVTATGEVGHGLGRAPQVAVADVVDGVVIGWQVHDVRWDVLHEEGSEGAHHARVARFLREYEVDAVVTGRVGPGMERMLASMGVRLVTGAAGDARAAAAAVQRSTRSGST